MKIEIDLTDIFCEQEDPCDLQEAIKQEVIRSLTQTLGKGIERVVREETIAVLNEELRKAVSEQMPQIVNDLINTTYTPVDKYGSTSAPTTFRQALVNEINANMVYRKTTFDSDKNIFTRAVDDVLKENITTFKYEMKKQVDSQYTALVLQEAASALVAKLGSKR